MKLYQFARSIILLVAILYASDSLLVFTANGWRFKNYSVDDGLAQNSINVFYQDNLGYLWIGTQDGISQFDGLTFFDILEIVYFVISLYGIFHQ